MMAMNSTDCLSFSSARAGRRGELPKDVTIKTHESSKEKREDVSGKLLAIEAQHELLQRCRGNSTQAKLA